MKSLDLLYVGFALIFFETILASNSEEYDDYSSVEDDILERKLIVRGKYAVEGMFPWMVALYHHGNFICSAFIISKNTLLTAAHCVVIHGVRQPASSFSGRAGSANRVAGPLFLAFDAVVVHPGYNTSLPSPAADIAVLKTRGPLPLMENAPIEPLCIMGRSTKPLEKRTATVMGWGRTKKRENSDPDNYPDILQFTEYRILSPLSCSFIARRDKGKICATARRSGFCSGDSGSPMIQYKKDGTPMAVGIASYGFDFFTCGSFVGPDIFMKIIEYIDFIEMNVETNVLCKK